MIFYKSIERLRGFMKRHVTLRLRKPESASLAKGIGFIKTRVEEFFLNYKNVLNKYKFTRDRIINLDKMGITTVLNPVRVVAPKEKKTSWSCIFCRKRGISNLCANNQCYRNCTSSSEN
ncbi:hypothetical protein NQ314_011628 [Rhamnusium bicolor]|uniref:Transposase n=1 Tax=Rhamnusium bicolor TaxID=1586634 RepID=A0AAV8XG80_9CUCU|nr:hypothetical protein NQ314_011628 [Rhamnusium bicolor]